MLSAQQKMAVESKDSRILVAAAAGSGKAQPYNTIIPTPNGKRKLGDLKIGDYVFDRLGKPTQILGIFPQGKIDSYKITLMDGRTTLCGKEHIWTCIDRRTNKKYDITVEDMLKKDIQENNRVYRYRIPVNEAIEMEEKDFDIDPYVIGAFLGDGCCTEDYLTFSSNDEEIVSEIAQLIGATEFYNCHETNYSWCFKKEKYFDEDTKRERTRFYTKDFFKNYSDELIQLSTNKKIPNIYKYGSISQRFSLLQGLMDTDGSIYKAETRYTVRFTNTSFQLINDIQDILWSLGYQSSISEDVRNKYKTGICYNLNFLIPNEDKLKFFRLKRKKDIAEEAANYKKHRNYKCISIKSIEKMSEQEEMLCIYVDNEEHLYLTNDYIVTHNTRVIVERIKHLIENGVEPSKIYAITYTNMAAQEMLERLDNVPISIGTIHSLANQILLSNGCHTFDWIEEQSFDKLLERINEDYDNDIELPEIEHLLVDEFQDVCDDEANFILYSLCAKNIFLVGDSCQSIYSFKGANYHWFMDLVDDKTTTVFKLETNYRNAPNILEHANRFLYHMNDIYSIKNIPNCKKDGLIIEEEYDLKNLYYYITKYGEYKDWFILCRTNAQVDDIMNYLKNKEIPCTTFKKAEKTFQELKDMLKENIVKILTIHSAKGLEAKNVLVIGMKQFNSEEKRICYVACTRAKEKLIIMNEPPKRGRRAQAGMYDDAGGRVMDFSAMSDLKNTLRGF